MSLDEPPMETSAGEGPAPSSASASNRDADAGVQHALTTAGDAAGELITSTPRRPFTLAIDVGGTGLKAAVLDAHDRFVADRVRVPTTYPLSAEAFLDAIATLVRPLPTADRVAMGFPGVVRAGLVITAPHFVTAKGPGSRIVPELVKDWNRFPIEERLAQRLGKPARVLNDADLQGLAVVSGKGLEFVVTLGTGVGTALFLDGKLAPHLELAHHPFRKGQTYNEQIGDAELSRIGRKRWRARVKLALEAFAGLINYDRCYVGGGNARLLRGYIESETVTVVDNLAGLLGGVKPWDEHEQAGSSS